MSKSKTKRAASRNHRRSPYTAVRRPASRTLSVHRTAVAAAKKYQCDPKSAEVCGLSLPDESLTADVRFVKVPAYEANGNAIAGYAARWAVAAKFTSGEPSDQVTETVLPIMLMQATWSLNVREWRLAQPAAETLCRALVDLYKLPSDTVGATMELYPGLFAVQLPIN